MQWASRDTPEPVQPVVPTAAPLTASIPQLPDPFAPGAQAPSFDVVRVGQSGSAVIAGQAEPGAEVTVRDGDKVLGRVRADRQGNWVLVPDAPLTEGGRELTVSETAPDGTETMGRDTVLLSIPHPSSGEKAAVLLVPQDGEARVLQAPTSLAPASLAPAPTPTLAPAPASKPAPAPVVTAAPVPPPAAAEAPPPVPRPAPPAVVASAPIPSSPTVFRPGPAKLSLATVDYSEHGEIRFAGTAAPNAPVRVYVDDAPTGDATADSTGHWGLLPPETVPGGIHRLRIDQLSAAGRVVARVELPFERSTLPPETIAAGRVIVQPGQNLWRLARKVYGSGVRYRVIYLANQDQIRNPKLIYPGQAFTVPKP